MELQITSSQQLQNKNVVKSDAAEKSVDDRNVTTKKETENHQTVNNEANNKSNDRNFHLDQLLESLGTSAHKIFKNHLSKPAIEILEKVHHVTGEILEQRLKLSEVLGRGELVEFVQDLIQKHHVENQALKQSLAEINDLYNKAPVGYHSLDLDGLILKVNDTELTWLGHTREEVVKKKKIQEFLTPKGIEDMDALMPLLLKGMPTNVEVELKKRDGTYLPVLVSSTSIFDDTGRFVRTRCTLTDLTQHKLVQKEKAHAEYARSLIEASLDPFLTVSPEGKIWDANQATYEITRLSRQELIGTEVAQLFVEPKKIHEAMRKALADGAAREIAVAIKRKYPHAFSAAGDKLDSKKEEQRDAEDFRKNFYQHNSSDPLLDGFVSEQKVSSHQSVDMLCNFSVYKNSEGRVQGLFLAARDVTETVKEKKIVEEQKKELSRSNDDLQHFASVAAHDLKEPLRAISGHLTNIEKRYIGEGTDEVREYMDYVIDAAKRMNILIDNLLNYSRVGSQRKTFRPIHLIDCLEAATNNLEVHIKECGARILFDKDRLPRLWADKTQLTQLFQNLISNALKFNCANGPVIQIEAQDKGEFWELSVRDNGIGFEQEYADQIFKIFRRLHGKSEYPGSGIGLALCQKIVERHGGKIWARSAPGKGATFYIRLPKNAPLHLQSRHDNRQVVSGEVLH